MMNKNTLLVILCLLVTPLLLPAQNYFRGEQTVIQPLQVMIENYTTVSLLKLIPEDPNTNRFDKYNAYTYLQIVRDSWGKDYHILYQTSFTGKILFLACSNNLAVICNNTEKPLNVFVNCIRYINDHISSIQNAAAAINCIVERLNYCSK